MFNSLNAAKWYKKEDWRARFRAYLASLLLLFFSHSGVSLCDPFNWSMPGFPILHHLLKLAPIHVHWVGGAIQPSHPLLSPSPPTFNLSQHQGLSKWVSSSHQVAKVLEFQLQCQSFQWSQFPLGWTAVQGTLKSLLQHHSSKATILQHSAFFMV